MIVLLHFKKIDGSEIWINSIHVLDVERGEKAGTTVVHSRDNRTVIVPGEPDDVATSFNHGMVTTHTGSSTR